MVLKDFSLYPAHLLVRSSKKEIKRGNKIPFFNKSLASARQVYVKNESVIEIVTSKNGLNERKLYR